MSVTMELAVFMGNIYLNNCQSIANTTDGLETVGWENHSWKYLSLIVDVRLSIFNARRSTSFQNLYCVLVRFSRTPNRTMHGKKDWDG